MKNRYDLVYNLLFIQYLTLLFRTEKKGLLAAFCSIFDVVQPFFFKQRLEYYVIIMLIIINLASYEGHGIYVIGGGNHSTSVSKNKKVTFVMPLPDRREVEYS